MILDGATAPWGPPRPAPGLPAPYRALLAALLVQTVRDLKDYRHHYGAETFLASEACEGLCRAIHFPYTKVKRLLLDATFRDSVLNRRGRARGRKARSA